MMKLSLPKIHSLRKLIAQFSIKSISKWWMTTPTQRATSHQSKLWRLTIRPQRNSSTTDLRSIYGKLMLKTKSAWLKFYLNLKKTRKLLTWRILRHRLGLRIGPSLTLRALKSTRPNTSTTLTWPKLLALNSKHSLSTPSIWSCLSSWLSSKNKTKPLTPRRLTLDFKAVLSHKLSSQSLWFSFTERTCTDREWHWTTPFTS